MQGWASLLAVGLAWLGLSLPAGGATRFPFGFVGSVTVEPAKGIVGSKATVSGSGFQPGSTLELVWRTYEGAWHLEYQEGEYTGNYLGRRFDETSYPLGTVTVGPGGDFRLTFEVPEDYGGMHDILVVQQGENLNKAGFYVEPHATMWPESGPVGTDITVRFTGLNAVHNMEGWYLLTYDNRVTGYLTAVTTKGTATAVIPATGRPGRHVVELKKSSFGAPYLALGTSPYGYLPVPRFFFTVTEGDPILPPPVQAQLPRPVPGGPPGESLGAGGRGRSGPQAGGQIWVDPRRAPVGTPAVIAGRGLPPNTAIRLELAGMVGSRVTPSGFAPVSLPIATVRTDGEGRFTLPYAFPDTHGGSHRVTAFAGDREVARTYLEVDRLALELEPAEGPVGTNLLLHLKGVGWTQTENIFAVVVDNTFIGYACGFSTNGDVRVPITASWEPGWHFIDLYPSFYRNQDYAGAEEQPFLYRQAILTWRDHPSGFHFRYAFRVTQGGEEMAAALAR